MIAGLRGRLDGKTGDALLIDVGGVVYRVYTSATSLADAGDVGDSVRILTHLFVREDQLTLYGFVTADELRLFETLISVTGVGPRLACAILSRVAPDLLHDAIARENAAFLATVPGVGKKTAARLILELRGKLTPVAAPSGAGARRDDDEVVEALQALGYTAAEANAAALRLPLEVPMTVEERVVAALRDLGEA
jgi:Holliday junction DNA helicase RuvA